MSEFDSILENVIKVSEQQGGNGVNIQTFKEAGILTNNLGLVVSVSTGEIFHITIQKDLRHGVDKGTSEEEFLRTVETVLISASEEGDLDFEEGVYDEDDEDNEDDEDDEDNE